MSLLRKIMTDFFSLGHPSLQFFCLISSLLMFSCSVSKISKSVFLHQNKTLQEGDLLFLDLDCGELCDAIEDVTKRQFQVDGPNLSHVGILIHFENDWKVIEAWDGVQLTSPGDFFNRVNHEQSRMRFARYRNLSATEWSKIRTNLLSNIGMPYDDDFLVNNGKYYCSELVVDMFPRFSYVPMFYGDPLNPEDTSWDIWSNYFRKKGKNVPQGKPGLSPLGIYLSKEVEIIN